MYLSGMQTCSDDDNIDFVIIIIIIIITIIIDDSLEISRLKVSSADDLTA